MAGPPCVGAGAALAATVYTENCGELANTWYGARASLATVPDAPRATATTYGPPGEGRLSGRAARPSADGDVCACAVVVKTPATAMPTSTTRTSAPESRTRSVRRTRGDMGTSFVAGPNGARAAGLAVGADVGGCGTGQPAVGVLAPLGHV